MNTSAAWTIIRFRSNGATDTTFGTSGIVRITFSGFGDSANNVAIDSNNRLLVAGLTYSYASTCGSYVKDAGLAR